MNLYLVLSTLNLCLGGLVFLLGVVILRENPGQRLNRLVSLMLFFGGFGAVLAGMGLYATQAEGARAVSQLLQNMSYVWELYFPTLFMFASIFPVERGFARRTFALPWRLWSPGFGVLVFAPHVFHFALALVLTLWRPSFRVPELGVLSYLQPVLNVGGVVAGLFLLVHQVLFALVNLGFGVATMALLYGSYRHTRVPRLRQQLRVIGVGLSASLVCYSLATSLPGLFNYAVPEDLRSVLTIAALTLGPGSIAYSIVRFKFLDAKLIVRRGILYALASAALVGIYLVVVSRAQRFVGEMSGADARVLEPVFLVVALVVFQPVIAWLEERLDQMFLRDPADYRNVLRQLGRDLQTTIDLDELLDRSARTLADALLLRTVHVVALTRDGPVARTGAGAPLSEERLGRLAAVLPRIAEPGASYRLGDRIEGLSPEEHADLAGGGALSLLVPLRWRGELVGALLLGDKVTGMVITSEDVQLLTTLAGQLSVSFQNALLLRDRLAVARFEEELSLARQIQRTSLLSEFPRMPRCEVHAVYLPSKEVGGDFYDVVPAGDGSFLLAIADVSGKGVPAALLSSMLQASLRTQAESRAGLGAILRGINTLLFRSTSVHQFATFFLARFDPLTLDLGFSNAGHNWPVVLRGQGQRHFLERGGTVLGILEGAEFEEDRIRLQPGDRLVLYTDGLTEAMNAQGEQFGEQRVCEFVEGLPRDLGAKEVAERTLGRLREFLGDCEPQDDITLLVLRALDAVPAATEPDPETVAAASR
jgi:sigma-B regulation protein RsbU (phosphoserine phosphatase)